MDRRELLGGLGAAVALPTTTHAQQTSMPVIGFLHPASADAIINRLRFFHRGLKETGFVEGENVTIAYRWDVTQSRPRMHRVNIRSTAG